MLYDRRRRWIAGFVAALAAALAAFFLLGAHKAPSARPFVIAASATANEPAPTLGAADEQRLRDAAESDDSSVLLVSPDGQSRELPLTPRRENGQVEHGPQHTELINANIKAIRDDMATMSATHGFDLLDTISQGVRASATPGTLLVASSTLSVLGGVDMQQVLWGADPKALARDLHHRGLLPDLSSWDVVFTGIGDTMPPQQPLQYPERRTLKAYWTAICQEAGAHSCTVNDQPRPEQPSRSPLPVPTVPVPEITSFQGPHGSRITTLPADALFAFDSTDIDQAALSVLGALAADIKTRHLRVTVTGYASPDGGTPTYNQDLSARRAHAVQDALIRLGVDPSVFDSVHGVGTDGHSPDACLTNGQVDRAKCAPFRKVVVVTSPSAVTS